MGVQYWNPRSHSDGAAQPMGNPLEGNHKNQQFAQAEHEPDRQEPDLDEKRFLKETK